MTIKIGKLSYYYDGKSAVLDSFPELLELGEFICLEDSDINAIACRWLAGYELVFDAHYKFTSDIQPSYFSELADQSYYVGCYARWSHSYCATTVVEEIDLLLCRKYVAYEDVVNARELLLNDFGISHLKNSSIASLSGGESQRLALAHAVLSGARILYLDNAFSDQDYKYAASLEKYFVNYAKLNNNAVIYIGQVFRSDVASYESLSRINGLPIRGEFILRVSELVVSVKGGRQLNQPVNFSLRKGDVCAVLGENGSGKTLLGTILYGSRPKELTVSGSIEWKTNDLVFGSEAAVVMMPQNAELFFSQSDVNAELNLNGLYEKGAEWVTSYISSVFSDKQLKMNPFELPRDKQKWLVLFIVLLSESDLIFLDEPSEYWDKMDIEIFSRLLNSISIYAKTILIVTHDSRLIEYSIFNSYVEMTRSE